MITASKWQRFLASTVIRGTLAMVVAVAGVGCKTGSTWTAKPSWWTFGGGPEDASKLASAPPAPTDVTKPSAAAKPYPTTTTPDGYVLANPQQPAGQSPAADAVQPQLQAAVEPAAVTYGSRPAVTATPEPPPTAPAQVATASGPQTGLSSITPQVGPYGSAPASAEQTPVATTASAFGGSAFGAVAGSPAGESAGTRVADARGADSWSTPPAAVPTTTESRYGSATGSRFSGGSMLEAPASTPAAFGSPAALPAEVSLPPSSAAPAAAPLPAASGAPPTPTRRPDPGYRPGGTSNYRTSRTILAGTPTGEPGAVQPASFQTDSGTGP